MSHDLEIKKDGVASMAWTNEVPWHGLGVKVDKAPSVSKMLKAASLEWAVEKRPMFLESGTLVPDAFALVRDSDSHILDVVGNHYTPVQNDEAFSFFKEYVEAGDATMETAGSLRGGRYVWGLANLGEAFKLKGNDTVKGYLLVGAPHQQGKSFIIKLTTVRVVCNNTLTMALRGGGKEFRMAHRRSFDASMVKKAKETLGIAREQFDEFHETAEKLQKMRMSERDAIDVLAPIFAPDVIKEEIVDEKLPPRLAKVMEALKYAPGAQPGNAWGVLNAVTYWADHMASKTTDKRLTNAWFGKTAGVKEKVLASLLD